MILLSVWYCAVKKRAHADLLLRMFAHVFQHPATKSQLMGVLYGGKGVGKTQLLKKIEGTVGRWGSVWCQDPTESAFHHFNSRASITSSCS